MTGEPADTSPAAIRHLYPDDPYGYSRDVLGVKHLWTKTRDIGRSLLRPPYKTMVKSGHKVGKSHGAGWLINWWYDSFNPGSVQSTAPTKLQLAQVLWKEVRLQRMRAGLPMEFTGPASTEMKTSPDHTATGITANRGEAFSGRHGPRKLIIFDEAIGVDPIFWTIAKTMFKPELGHAWLVFFNPTDTSTVAYQEEQSGEWNVVTLSCLEHPNIEQQLRGELPDIPDAVTLPMIDGWLREWCTRISADEATLTDFQWPPPPHEGVWYRPGPEWECRVCGLWPSQGIYSVWSDALWQACAKPERFNEPVPVHLSPQIGCDVARFGDDRTAFHIRWGTVSLHHESYQGWRTTATTGRLIEMCRETAEMVNKLRKEEGARRPDLDPKQIPIKVDDDGVGGGVTDGLFDQGYMAVPIRALENAAAPDRYPDRRSELWFQIAKRAHEGLVSFARLDKGLQHTLRLQFMAPNWKLDGSGRRAVERKEVTKEKIGRSPDDADAVNLAYYEDQTFEPPEQLPPQERRKLRPDEWHDRGEGRGRGRRLFGR